MEKKNKRRKKKGKCFSSAFVSFSKHHFFTLWRSRKIILQCANKFLNIYSLINGQFLKITYAWDIESMCVHKHMWCVCARACMCVRASVCMFCYWQAAVLRVNFRRCLLTYVHKMIAHECTVLFIHCCLWRSSDFSAIILSFWLKVSPQWKTNSVYA